jgi:hypothetical protein
MSSIWRKWFGGGTTSVVTGPPIYPALREWDGVSPLDLPEDSLTTPPLPPGERDATLLCERQTDESALAAQVDELIAAIQTALTAVKGDKERHVVYSLTLRDPLAPLAGRLLADLDQAVREKDKLLALGRWLVETAAHREPLKLGILLLGAAGARQELDNLRRFAQHDELTYFAARAIERLVPDPVPVWLELAKNVHGWGKIHLVKWLAPHAANNAALRDWLLRHGVYTQAGHDRLALVCATAGRLDEALNVERTDDELLDGAAAILRALFLAPPDQGIDAYPEAFSAVVAFLHHFDQGKGTIRQLGLVPVLKQWLAWPPPANTPADQPNPWPDRATRGWDDEARDKLSARCARALAWKGWNDLVVAAFDGQNDYDRQLAWQLAPLLHDLDLWDKGFRRLKTKPLDPPWIHRLTRTTNLVRLGSVFSLVEEMLPIKQVGRGPTTRLANAAEWRVVACLEPILDAMQTSRILSDGIVAAGLRCPWLPTRQRAVAALQKHSPERWGKAIKDAIKASLDDEPDENLAAQLRELVLKAIR